MLSKLQHIEVSHWVLKIIIIITKNLGPLDGVLGWALGSALWGDEARRSGQKGWKSNAAATKASAYAMQSFEAEMILQKSQPRLWVGAVLGEESKCGGCSYFRPRAIPRRGLICELATVYPPAGV